MSPKRVAKMRYTIVPYALLVVMVAALFVPDRVSSQDSAVQRLAANEGVYLWASDINELFEISVGRRIEDGELRSIVYELFKQLDVRAHLRHSNPNSGEPPNYRFLLERNVDIVQLGVAIAKAFEDELFHGETIFIYDRMSRSYSIHARLRGDDSERREFTSHVDSLLELLIDGFWTEREKKIAEEWKRLMGKRELEQLAKLPKPTPFDEIENTLDIAIEKSTYGCWLYTDQWLTWTTDGQVALRQLAELSEQVKSKTPLGEDRSFRVTRSEIKSRHDAQVSFYVTRDSLHDLVSSHPQLKLGDYDFPNVMQLFDYSIGNPLNTLGGCFQFEADNEDESQAWMSLESFVTLPQPRSIATKSFKPLESLEFDFPMPQGETLFLAKAGYDGRELGKELDQLISDCFANEEFYQQLMSGYLLPVEGEALDGYGKLLEPADQIGYMMRLNPSFEHNSSTFQSWLMFHGRTHEQATRALHLFLTDPESFRQRNRFIDSLHRDFFAWTDLTEVSGEAIWHQDDETRQQVKESMALLRSKRIEHAKRIFKRIEDGEEFLHFYYNSIDQIERVIDSSEKVTTVYLDSVWRCKNGWYFAVPILLEEFEKRPRRSFVLWQEQVEEKLNNLHEESVSNSIVLSSRPVAIIAWASHRYPWLPTQNERLRQKYYEQNRSVPPKYAELFQAWEPSADSKSFTVGTQRWDAEEQLLQSFHEVVGLVYDDDDGLRLVVQGFAE